MPAFNFKAQFAPLVAAGTKRMTIRQYRKGPRRQPALPGERLTLWTGMRTKGCRKLYEATCRAALPVQILPPTVAGLPAHLFVGSTLLSKKESDLIARCDGFADFAAMAEFFRATHGLPFSGALITW